MAEFSPNRTVTQCSLMGDGTAFAAATVTSSAPKVFKFVDFKGQAYLSQLEIQFSVLSNSSTNITVGLYRNYDTATQVLTAPVAGMSLSAATQAASFTYNASTASNDHANGGGVTFPLDVYLSNHTVNSANSSLDLYVVVVTNHAGNSTLSSLSLVHTY
jgi:hypothetical protein